MSSENKPLDPSERQFDEKEISRVLKRATELQDKHGASKPFGLTLQELQQVASESGIDPAYISAAVAELSADGEVYSMNIWGGPTSFHVDRVIPGSIDDTTWETMIGAIRKRFKQAGEVHTRGEIKEWIHAGDNKQAHVSITPVDSGTQIQAFWSEPVMAAPVYVIMLVLSVIMVPVIFESLGMVSMTGIALLMSVISVFFLAARTALSRMVRAERKKISRLVAELEAIASEQAGVAKSGMKQVLSTLEDNMLDQLAEEQPKQPVSKKNRVRS